jgi:hypothetical protein
MEIWVEAGGTSKYGTSILQVFKSKGLNPTQAQSAISALAKGSSGGEILAKSLKVLDSKTLSVVSSMMKSGDIASVVNFISPQKLSVVLESVQPSTAATMVASISGKTLVGLASSLSAKAAINVFPAVAASSENLNSLVVNMGGATLSSTLMDLKLDQLNMILPNISTKSWSIITPKLNSGVLNKIVSNLSPEQLNRIVPDMNMDQINVIMPNLTTEQLNDTLQALNISPSVIQQYLQTGQLSKVENVSLLVLKRLLDEHIKRSKKESKEEKLTYFEVRLFYTLSSEAFKIKAHTFKEATYIALQRRQTQQLPIELTVRTLKG